MGSNFSETSAVHARTLNPTFIIVLFDSRHQLNSFHAKCAKAIRKVRKNHGGLCDSSLMRPLRGCIYIRYKICLSFLHRMLFEQFFRSIEASLFLRSIPYFLYLLG